MLPFRLICINLNGPVVSMFGKGETCWADSPAIMAVGARNRGDRSDHFKCADWARHKRVAATGRMFDIEETLHPIAPTVLHLMAFPPPADQPASPWYREGLRFECTQCGNCCTGMPGHVWVNEADIQRIAEFLDKPVGEIRLLRTRPARGRISLNEYTNGDCTFFEPATRRCTIYPVRPLQCRTWPFWRSNLADEAAWRQAERACPGAGCGVLVPLEEIERRASDQNL
jgi:uncharacterized protein